MKVTIVFFCLGLLMANCAHGKVNFYYYPYEQSLKNVVKIINMVLVKALCFN